MNEAEIQELAELGEDSKNQFKEDIKSPDSLAAEMSAFANCDGGRILFGVADDGTVPGLTAKDVRRINQMISNTANNNIRSPLTVRTENAKLSNDNFVIILTIPQGVDRPYFDRNGHIWLKNGSDKRRVNSKEELLRLFQGSNRLHADELPVKAAVGKMDKLRFRDFLREKYHQDFPETHEGLVQLLQNMNLAGDEGNLNLAGALLFAEQPQLIKPQFIVKAATFPGTSITASEFLDSEDIEGPFQRIFDDAMAFVMRNLKKIQKGGVNSPGVPEIPSAVFEEVLVNALVHRDYTISAPIRLLVFDNRIEVLSPGHLPDNLTIEKVIAGNSNIRNPVLASFVAKGVLPYKGLGSGVRRALENWPKIQFVDDRGANAFKVIIQREFNESSLPKPQAPDPYMLHDGEPIPYDEEYRKAQGAIKAVRQSHQPNLMLSGLQRMILHMIEQNPDISYDELAFNTLKNKTTIMRNIQKLKAMGLLERIGSRKTGFWRVIGNY